MGQKSDVNIAILPLKVCKNCGCDKAIQLIQIKFGSKFLVPTGQDTNFVIPFGIACAACGGSDFVLQTETTLQNGSQAEQSFGLYGAEGSASITPPKKED